ncbi:28S ribosomal protein S31, mitochondrial isoform X2 [Lingula anatina]|uniref:Small ribosomal subunit protein mS31 n=1 Tax=Lingula anatina TaxID=7574 RepID=A0A1S3HDN3_LINAN|nr:28S ribosomal protein S31, mitochondrial isoform X2 [Lingula anatina]|eukprot:XP_013383199.1 28S ribosomal protein S31, mitochondrial isoform X2 [Lingula anatina]
MITAQWAYFVLFFTKWRPPWAPSARLKNLANIIPVYRRGIQVKIRCHCKRYLSSSSDSTDGKKPPKDDSRERPGQIHKTNKPRFGTQVPSDQRKAQAQKRSTDSPLLKPNVVKAAKAAANSVNKATSDADLKELLAQLKKIESKKTDINKQQPSSGVVTDDLKAKDPPAINLDDLVSGMEKLKKTQIRESLPPKMPLPREKISGRASQPPRQREYQQRGPPPITQKPFGPRIQPVDVSQIFNMDEEKRLNIFPKTMTKERDLGRPRNAWDDLIEKERDQSIYLSPTNGFEEWILWTKQGRLFKFPIDNEQDWDYEADVPFYEHVFLERHIQDIEPGPVRQFLELVCVGLGKNPWISAEEKREHLEWFKSYFVEKSAVLEEVKQREMEVSDDESDGSSSDSDSSSESDSDDDKK